MATSRSRPTIEKRSHTWNRPRRTEKRGARRAAQLHIEHLEDRVVLSTLDFLVNTTLPASGSPTATSGGIADAVAAANADTTDTAVAITFDSSVFTGVVRTIQLTKGLVLNPENTSLSVNIDATSAGGVTLRGAYQAASFSVITLSAGTTDLTDLTITNGFAADTGVDSGGGIYNTATLTIDNCSVANNFSQGHPAAALGGGAGIYNSGTLTVLNSTINNNTAFGSNFGAYGGGILNDGTLTVTNSTIANNSSANSGGGIYSSPGSHSTLLNDTITGNSILSFGNGAGLENNSGNDISLTNTIVAGNAANGDLYAETGSTYSGSFDIIGDASSLSNLTSSQAGQSANLPLAALNYYGGPTRTVALLGTPFVGTSTGAPTLDQRGFSRGSSVDIGAYQAQSSAINSLVTTANDPGVPGMMSLRGAIDLADLQTADVAITFAGAYSVQMTMPVLFVLTNSHSGEAITIDATSVGGVAVIGGGQFADVGVFGVDQGTVTITDLSISRGNQAYGGGIYNYGTLTLTNCVIADNAASIQGGGVYNAGSLAINGGTITKNASRSGGGIYSTQTLTVAGTTISSNTAADGGGVYNNDTLATFADCTFSNNTATQNGGGIYGPYGTLTIDGSTFSGNSAVNGGGLANTADTLTVNNSTFSGNTASSSGGGADLQGGTLNGCTFGGNSAPSGGGGGIATTTTGVSLTDTIVAGSTGGDLAGSSLAVGSSSNLVDDLAASTGLVDGANGNLIDHPASLSALGSFGGPTKTIALLAGSSAPGAGRTVTLTTLGDDLDASSTRIPAASPYKVGVGIYVVVDSEVMLVVGIPNGYSLDVLRGQLGTTAAIHGHGTALDIAADQRGVLRSATPSIGAFEVVPATISSVSPNHGPGLGGTAVTLVGAQFFGGATVTVGGVAATNVVVVNSTTITFTAPAGQPGPSDVVLTNGDGNKVTITGGFAYENPIVVGPASLPSPTVGVPFSQQFTASGGSGAGFVFSSSDVLPDGLTLSKSGLLSGTPTDASGVAFFVTVTATDGEGGTGRTLDVLQVKGASQAGTVVSSVPRAFYGENVVLTATFSATAVGGAPMTGTASFYDGDTLLGTATLIAPGIGPFVATIVSGQASLPTTTLGVGNHVIRAVYSGDDNYSPATSGTPVSVRVDHAVASTTLSASTAADGSTLGALVVVTSPGDPSTAGSVLFSDNGKLLGSSTVVNGLATFHLGTLAPGSHSFSSVFSGSGNSQASGSSGTISIVPGRVYLDLNADGKPEAGEPGLAGRVVFLDLNGNGTADLGEPTAITDAAGDFTLTTTVAGTFAVSEATSQDIDDRHVVDQTQIAADGSVNIGVVPISPVAPVPVVPSPFSGSPDADASTAYVRSLYKAVLGRAGADSEVATWLVKIGAGMTRPEVAMGFVNSVEHRRDQVRSYYEDFLHREPEPGSAIWVDALLSGASEEAVTGAILDSPEYQSAHQDSSLLVHDLYLDVLGRQGEAAGVAGWISALASGASTSSVVAAFVESSEAIDQIVLSDYTAFLHRGRELGTTSDIWVEMMEAPGGSATVVATGILTSPEFEEYATTPQG